MGCMAGLHGVHAMGCMAGLHQSIAEDTRSILACKGWAVPSHVPHLPTAVTAVLDAHADARILQQGQGGVEFAM